MTIFEKIKDAITFRELLAEYGMEYSEGGILCPLPDHDASAPRFKIFTSDSGHEVGHCFSPNCEFHGDVIDFEAAMKGISVGAAARELAARYNIPIPEWSEDDLKAYEESRTRRELLWWLYAVNYLDILTT